MLPKKLLQQLAMDVSRRSGIHQNTVEQVLPAIFDEIRYRLCEARYKCVPIESFGTFGVVEIPEREYVRNYKGVETLVHLEPKKQLKFYPTRNLRLEIEANRFDPEHRSFQRFPKDPPIRLRNKMEYQPMKTKVHKGETSFKGPKGKVVGFGTDD